MSVWHGTPDLEQVRRDAETAMVRHLGIRITGCDDDSLTATMPVDDRTRQPAGLLHGGASAVLAETLGSLAANLAVDPSQRCCVGLVINANHLRPVREGQVTGTARALHIGRSTHLWQIDIRDDSGRLCCVARLTVKVLEMPASSL